MTVTGVTRCSDEVKGDRGNYGRSSRFSVDDETCVRISQRREDEFLEMVILTAHQFDALVAFVTRDRARRP